MTVEGHGSITASWWCEGLLNLRALASLFVQQVSQSSSHRSRMATSLPWMPDWHFRLDHNAVDELAQLRFSKTSQLPFALSTWNADLEENHDDGDGITAA
jgi:hypothetical protein